MRISNRGGVPWRIILIQVIVLGGIAAFLKFYLPRQARKAAAREVTQREQNINDLFQNAVEEDDTQKIDVPLEGAIVKRYPQRLRVALSPSDVETKLGAPGKENSDFQGGQHLTWFGTTHRLEASFNGGKLYCLTLEDRTTGHGVMVFESPLQWHPY